jgi:hypothetical protein
VFTCLSIVGTRPEAIKMAPVIKELTRHPDRVRSLICSTGQYRQMLDQVFNLFAIKPDFELNVMHIVFLWPSFWWLEHYAEFARYLRERFACVLENDRLVVFDLTSA